MASKSSSPSHLCSKQKAVLILVLVSITLPLFVLLVNPQTAPVITTIFQVEKTNPAWFDVIQKNIGSKSTIKVGLVNLDTRVDGNLHEQLDALHPQVKTISVEFDHVDHKLKWEDFFPEWIEKWEDFFPIWINYVDEKWVPPKCPDLPMPTLENYRDLNVVVAKVPCGKGNATEAVRDVFRLQVNLVVANLAEESGWVNSDIAYEDVYVVFIGSCGPMLEIFRCDDLLFHQFGEYWVYKPHLGRLRQKTLMPVGTCQIAPGYAETGKEVWRGYMRVPRFAYVTVLHSSEAYVCGAIALAQSILQNDKSILRYNNYTIDLLILVDDSIGPHSIKGLKAAGWKIKRIQRILNPFAEKGSYNEWNYSKLRIWQLTMYDKIIFLDSDLLVLKNIDDFFTYPQLSAAPNHQTLFNSGLMIIEPSMCMFEHLMRKSLEVKPYNGGDQGFINDVFTWWHRLPSKLNYLKGFYRRSGDDNKKHGEIPEDLYAIHFFGSKPWMCYRDYDCNWDIEDHFNFSSDSTYKKWWMVYDTMSKELQSYCGLTEEREEKIIQRRKQARIDNLPYGYWKIEIKDPRRNKHDVDYN